MSSARESSGRRATDSLLLLLRARRPATGPIRPTHVAGAGRAIQPHPPYSLLPASVRPVLAEVAPRRRRRWPEMMQPDEDRPLRLDQEHGRAVARPWWPPARHGTG